MPQKFISMDLNLKEEHEGYHLLSTCPAPVGRKILLAQEKQLQSSMGGNTITSGEQQTTKTSAAAATSSQQQQQALVAKLKSKAMAIATKPGQQIMMNAFMMWMSGKQLNIFSISITSMAIMTPLQSILSLEKTFGPLSIDGDGASEINMPKLIYVALNLVWLCMGLYKMSSMRLLPTTSADWTGSIVWKEMMEATSIPPT